MNNLELKNISFLNDEYAPSNKNYQTYKMKDLPGSLTSKHTRPEMVRLLKNIFENKKIIFYQDFIVSQEAYSNLKISVKEELINQIKSFVKEKYFSKDPEVGTLVKYHGKIRGGNDDFVMAMMICIYKSQKFFTLKNLQNERHLL